MIYRCVGQHTAGRRNLSSNQFKSADIHHDFLNSQSHEQSASPRIPSTHVFIASGTFTMRCSFAASALLPLLLSLPLVSGILPVHVPLSKDQNPIRFSEDSQKMSSTAQGDDVPIVSDLLSVQKDVSIFADFVRGSQSIIERLENAHLNTTVLAPLNSAVRALPRKPWEDPDPDNNYEGAFAGIGGEKRAAENLERFVKAHLIPVSPFNENEKVQTLGGRTIWWATENGVVKIFPDGIEVKDVKNSVPNGQIWTLTKVINYSSE